MIETMRFRLAGGVDESAFLEADKALQEEFAYQQSGLLRRTTARADDGEWLVIDLWSSATAAQACADRWDADPVVRRFMGMVDPASVVTARYEDIGG